MINQIKLYDTYTTYIMFFKSICKIVNDLFGTFLQSAYCSSKNCCG